MRELASRSGSHDLSLTTVARTLLAPVSFHGDVVTPSGTALGGSVDVALFPDGRYTFDVHMHDSGFDPYDFRVRAAVTVPGGACFVFQVSGHTDGTGSDLLGSPTRDFDHHEEAVNDLIASFWLDARRGSFDVSKSYEDSGLLSVAEDLLKDLLGFLVADITLGAGLALVVCCAAEVSDALDVNIAGPGGLVGVLVAGGIAWVWGPAAILAAVAGGVVAGAVTDAVVDHRQLTEAEYDFAAVVFGDTLPPRESIYVTNLSWDGGRAFTWPNVDHNVLLNINNAYADPVNYPDDSHPDSGYPTAGQLLVHELVHAWQIHQDNFVPGLICDRLTTTSAYQIELTKQWSELGLEEQAKSIDSWFGAHGAEWTSLADLTKKLSSPAATSDPLFGYVSSNLRLGIT